tara:strand:+ start:160 stop:366 length:207 start_codon:yes stop_codon:yes gene_type:complete
MFDPVLLLQMAITAFIMLTMKPAKASSSTSTKKSTFKNQFNPDVFTSSDGRTYALHSGMWIEERILNH